MKNSVSTIFLLLFFQVLSAQDFIIKGVVTDMRSEPLAGASILEKGSPQNKTITNAYGEYTMKVTDPKKSILIFSFIGMVTKEMPVKDRKELDVKLDEDAVMLDEAVAIGYGSMQKKDLIGAVYTITGAELADMPVPTLYEALKGRIPGLVISSSDGGLEAEVSVRIRGGISITQDNSPLYIVDGVQMDDALNRLSPTDVERVDVLKDAASTAIYGAEGANGVILITTKRGVKGRQTILYDTYFSFKKLGRKVPLLNPHDFVIYSYEQTGGAVTGWEDLYGKFADVEENFGDRPGIDWQDEMYGSLAISQMHKVTLNGGSEKTRYNVAYTFNDNGNTVPDSWSKKHNLRVTLDNKIKNFSFKTDFNYGQSKSRGMGVYQENGGKILDLLKYAPTIGLYGDDANLLIWDGFYEDEEDNDAVILNPFTQLKSQIRKGKELELAINTGMRWDIYKGLAYNITVGYAKRRREWETFNTSESSSAKLGSGASGSVQDDIREYYSGNHTLSYSLQYKKDVKMDFLVGQELTKQVRSRIKYGAGGFPTINLGMDNMALATIPEIPQSEKESYQSAGFFARASASIGKKYLINATLRADGKSQFQGKNKWGYFPSVGVAWRMSEEPFIQKLGVFSNLKFRFSFGTSGNARISDEIVYVYSPDFVPVDNVILPAYKPLNLYNPDLKWETNKSSNFGLDFSFLKNRLSFVLDAYITNTDNLLLKANIPYINGFSVAMRNAGKTRNKGFELGITSQNISNKNFSWSTNFNIALNRRQVLALADSERWEYYSNSGAIGGADYMIEVGGNTGKMWGYEYDGIYVADDFNYIDGQWVLKDGIVNTDVLQIMPGVRKYKDLDGNNFIDEKDKTYIGDANPLFTGGIVNSFSFKNFDISFFCEFKVGGDIYNANLFTYLRAGKRGNTVQWVFDKRYKTVDEKGNFLLNTGDIANLNRLNNGREIVPGNGYTPLDGSFIENGSYLRISNVTIGYSLPRNLIKKIKMQNLRFYITANNLFTITGYSGYDPEVSMNRNGGMTPGIDRGAMPRTLNWVVGANLSF